MRRFRLVTLNIAHGRGLNPIQGASTVERLQRNLQRIAALLRRIKPDVVALQEIDQCSAWAGNFDQLDYLARRTSMAYSAFGVHNRREGRLNLAYGNAILSRHPLITSETVSFGERRVGEKGFIYAELELPDGHLPLVNLHLHYRSRAKRFDQLDRLLEFLQEKEAAHGGTWPTLPIVCGDFNTPEKAADVTGALLEHLQELGDYSLHPRRGRTFPSVLPVRRLDFVYLPPRALRPKSRVLRSLVSDHRPVMVDFQLA
jgi:endonuclease/exonuclease/phosphatase family metal-dependent hydrolase